MSVFFVLTLQHCSPNYHTVVWALFEVDSLLYDSFCRLGRNPAIWLADKFRPNLSLKFYLPVAMVKCSWSHPLVQDLNWNDVFGLFGAPLRQCAASHFPLSSSNPGNTANDAWGSDSTFTRYKKRKRKIQMAFRFLIIPNPNILRNVIQLFRINFHTTQNLFRLLQIFPGPLVPNFYFFRSN